MFVAVLLGAIRAAADTATITTVYVGRHFELRGHDQPVKYVFNGDTRVARVTGSLSTNTRIQRLRLQPGWNLCSLAVTAANVMNQITNSQSIFRWDPSTVSWISLAPGDTLPAGTVLWLHTTTTTTLSLTGTYSDPTNRAIAAGSSFQPGSGLEVLPLQSLTAELALSGFDAFNQQWQLNEPSIPFSDPGFPGFLAPGEAIFLNADTPSTLEVPESALRVRYYHQDHLGSSSVMTDADGALVEETAFYPFGTPRNEHQPRLIEENYLFTQKERDKESGLDYFEARYLVTPLDRFSSVDPVLARQGLLNAEARRLPNPQSLDPYAYTLNNPIRFVDAKGEDVSSPPASRKADPMRLPGGIQIRLVSEDMAGPGIVRDLWTGYHRNVADPTINKHDWSSWRSSNPEYVKNATSGPLPGQFTALFLSYEGSIVRNTEWTSVTPKVSIRTFYSSPEAQKDPSVRAAAEARTAQIVDYLHHNPLPVFQNVDRPGNNYYNSNESLSQFSTKQDQYIARMYQSFETPKGKDAK